MPRLGVGIGIGLPSIVAAAGGYDADAQAFFDRVATAGGTLTTTEKNATNQLVLDMKSAGIWTSMKAVYPMVGASANLLSYTEDFTNAFWSKLRTSVTSNATIAPDGTLTADALFETAVNDFHGLENANAITLINGSTYTQSIYVKPIGRRYIALTTQWGGGTLGAWFDTQNVVVYSTDSGVTANITTANNGFYRITITRTSPATNGYMNIWYDDSTPTAGVYFTGNTYLGDVTKGFYIWGAQLELGSTATTYIPVLGNRTTEAAAACAQNLVSASFTGTFTSGWTFASTGVKGNGTSAYFDTTCVPNVSLNQNSQHLCYYSRDNFNNSLISCGGGPYHQNLYTGGSFYGILSSSSFTAISIATTKGMSLISRTSSGGGTTSYWNNTNIGNDGIVSSGQYNYSLYVNARNSTGTGGFFSSNECAFASIGDGLTNTQASNFYTAVQAFQTTLSRQV